MKNLPIISLALLLLLSFSACKKKAEKELQTVSRQERIDSLPNMAQKPKIHRMDIEKVFVLLPDTFFQNRYFAAPDISQRQSIVEGDSAFFRELVVDTLNHYLFFTQEEKEKGILTTLKSFACKDSSEIFALENSYWNLQESATEKLFLFRKTKQGWESLNFYDYIPSVRLQDFFKKEVPLDLKNIEDSYMPTLLYELQRNSARIRVFLGEIRLPNRKFTYKGDIDYIELEWRDCKFYKVETAQGL